MEDWESGLSVINWVTTWSDEPSNHSSILVSLAMCRSSITIHVRLLELLITGSGAIGIGVV